MIEVNNVSDGLVYLLFAAILYLLPGIVALTRWRLLGHEQVTKIIAINVFLGWLIFGWIYAMFLAARETYIERQENPRRRIY